MAEPSPETKHQIGNLCMAWSFLESVSEQTLWGILDVDERLWPIITWRHDLENRWKLILQYAPKKHDKDACDSLRKIKKQLTIKVIRDRNIIVHGLVHAMAEIRNPQPEADNTIDAPVFVMPPCWSEAGKNFPISENAVEIVVANIGKIITRVQELNKKHGYHNISLLPTATMSRRIGQRRSNDPRHSFTGIHIFWIAGT